MKKQIVIISGAVAITVMTIVAGQASRESAIEKPSSNLHNLSEEKNKDTLFELPKNTTRLPALLVKKDAEDTVSVPLRMSRVKMDIKVVGNISTTTLDITYCNDLDRLLDGQFCLPLGEGQNISYFALEQDGVLNEASVVEKEKGRKTYEAVIRRKIDPALLEWTAGNNFRTRIYPIPAHGCRRVVVKYESELIATGKSDLYYQPLAMVDQLEEFSVHAEVINQNTEPRQLDDQGVPLKFENEGKNWVMDKSWNNYKTNKALAFEIPSNKNTRNIFFEKNKEGSNTFYLSFYPRKFKAEKKLPSKICLLWDVSGSGEQRDKKAELNILNAYLQKVKNAEIEVVTFSNDIVGDEKIMMNEGNTEALKEKIKNLVYDGGTQLGNLDLTKYSCDEFILASDALQNFGSDRLKTGTTPVHVLCSSPLSDYSFAKGIAQSTGGRFLNLMTTDSASCMEKLCNEDYQFISAEYDPAAVAEVYPSQPVSIQKNFCLSGKTNALSTEIKLNFGFGNTIAYSEKITLMKDEDNYNGVVNRVWAEKKINELDVFYKRNEKEITALGKKYEIVTRNTSMIVLDRLEDYLTHEIVPKNPEMKKNYFAALTQEDRNKKQELKDHLENVVRDFDELKDWYNTDFYTSYLKAKQEKKKEEERLKALQEDQAELSRSVADSTSTFTFMNGNSRATNNVSFTAPAVAGTYAISVTDGNGAAVATGSSVNLTAAGGASGYTFAWDAGKATGENTEGADISLNAYNPETPYMKELKKVSGSQQAYLKYLSLKKQYASTPSFFVDVSDYFIKLNDKKHAVRVLSNLAEMELENHQMLRVLAHRLQEMEETPLAVSVFEKVLEIRGEEPQSYRDLGLAYAQNKEYQKAVNTMCKVVNRTWDGRFPQVEAFVACEINNIISLCNQQLDLSALDKRLIKAMPCDVRVVINWDSDNCDMDLWVTDPDGEKCFYGNRNTAMGGRISNDFTGGYGPETFMIKKAMQGKYKVEVNYFGTSSQSIMGPTTVQAELYTNWGRSGQKKKVITLRLKDATEIIDIGALAFTQ